jgi:predicted DNA-binding protein with PD1-like motif
MAKEMAKPNRKSVYGKSGRILPIMLPPDKDLITSIKKTCNDNEIRAGTILTAVGSLQKLTVTIPVPSELFSPPYVIDGPLQVLSLVGIIFEKDSGELDVHIHGSFMGQDGIVHGGHLVEGECPVLRRLEAVIGEIADVRLLERFGDTMHPEFSVETL